MVGTAYEIAAGRTSIAEITSRLDGTNKTTVHHKAPASGLILEKVEYDLKGVRTLLRNNYHTHTKDVDTQKAKMKIMS